MIVDIDRYMWRSACEIISGWKEDKKDLFISVNISPKDFYFMNVGEELKALVKEYDIDPKRLRLEITETVMMTDGDNRMKILNDLREAGFIVEIDDFGSGFSSLNLLKDMPVDVLKIDMAFLSKTENITKAKKIVQNIILLSNDIGIESLIEGVETYEQYDTLSKMGCILYQGYYFSKPIPVAEFEEFASQN
jgi:FOG: EAL domain